MLNSADDSQRLGQSGVRGSSGLAFFIAFNLFGPRPWIYTHLSR